MCLIISQQLHCSEEWARGQDFQEFRSEVDDYENGCLVQNGVSLVITQPGYHCGEPVPCRKTGLCIKQASNMSFHQSIT